MSKDIKNKLNEGHLLPDPKGLKEATATKSYHKEINDLVTKAIEKARKEALTNVLDKLKAELTDKLICIIDENSKQKIVYVSDIIIEKNGNENAIFIVEKNEDDKGDKQERKIRFAYENPKSGNVFDMGKFLEFFEEHFMGKFIQFSGKPAAGGSEGKFRKEVVQIGLSNDRNQDYIIVECDDNTRLLLYHASPISLIEEFLKELDPYSEEDWDN